MRRKMEAAELIRSGKTALGIELGSTRIKGVLVDFKGNVLAVGIHDWENSLVDNIWTYSLDEIHEGVRSCYSSLRKKVEEKYGIILQSVGAMGVSAMMHGYMALDKKGKQIAPFQTWRNTNTQKAADELTELFQFNIPLRWTVAHLYERILDGEAHVKDLDYVSTLSAYIHWKLTGRKVIGIGDAAGMFPIDSDTHDYDADMMKKFNALIEKMDFHGRPKKSFRRFLLREKMQENLPKKVQHFWMKQVCCRREFRFVRRKETLEQVWLPPILFLREQEMSLPEQVHLQ